MKFPTAEFLADFEAAGPEVTLLLPPLNPRQAWLLDQILEQAHTALWENHAEDILDYEDGVQFPDLHSHEKWEPASPPPMPCEDPPDIPF